MSDALVLQASGAPTALFLLFHGVGATPASLAPVGAKLAQAFPSAAVVSVAAPDASDLGAGLQWFSVRGVTEANRPERVAATLPRFIRCVEDWQRRLRVGTAGTTLVGFSQGAIMALAAASATPAPAARVVSLSGRFAEPPRQAPAGVRLHFVHGAADPVIPAAHAEQAQRALQSLGGTATLDVVPGLGHGVDARALELLAARLRAP